MNKLFLSTTCWLVLGVSLWADPSSSPKGVIVLTSASGLDPRNVLFSDLAWTDFYGGNVIDTNGQKTVFAKKDIGKIVYFDSNYYAQLDNDQREEAFRSGIQAREVVVNTAYSNLDSTNNLKSIQDGEKTLESVAHEYPAIHPLIQPQIDVLKDDISKLSGGQGLVDGKWMNQQEAAAQGAVPVVGEVNKPVTFTTKDGKRYVNATVSPTDNGLSIVTTDGGASVPFDQLPDDLSAFPKNVRKKVEGRRLSLFRSLASIINSKIGVAGMGLVTTNINVETGDIKIVTDLPRSSFGGVIWVGSGTTTQWMSADSIDLKSIKVEKRDDPREAYYCVDLSTINNADTFTESTRLGGPYFQLSGGSLEYIANKSDADNIANRLTSFISWRQSQPSPVTTEAEQIYENSPEGRFSSRPIEEQKRWRDEQLKMAKEPDFQNRVFDWASQQYGAKEVNNLKTNLTTGWIEACQRYTKDSPMELEEDGGVETAYKNLIACQLRLTGIAPVTNQTSETLQPTQEANISSSESGAQVEPNVGDDAPGDILVKQKLVIDARVIWDVVRLAKSGNKAAVALLKVTCGSDNVKILLGSNEEEVSETVNELALSGKGDVITKLLRNVSSDPSSTLQGGDSTH